METFLRYFPAAETFYSLIVALAVGLLLLNLIFQLFRNFGIMQSGAVCAVRCSGLYSTDGIFHGRLYEHHQYFPQLVQNVRRADFYDIDECLVSAD